MALKNQKKMSTKNLKKYFPMSTATFLLFGITGLFLAFPGRHLATEISAGLLGYIGGIFIFAVVNFVLAGVADPGTIPKRSNPEDDEDELNAPVYITVLVHDISVRMKWCSTCNFYRPPRVSHCRVCNSCVEKFDHHCPWVNNCIGHRNYQFFFWFLTLLSIHMVNVFLFSLWAAIMTKDVENLRGTFTVAIAVMAIDGLLFIPVSGLAMLHISLIVRGRTTNEQVTGKFQSGVNPFDDGCRQNCFNALCYPKPPKFVNSVSTADYAKYTITQPYTYDHVKINFNENLKHNDNLKHTSESKIELQSCQKEAPQFKPDVGDTGATLLSITPEVRVLSRDGNICNHLNPNQLCAKVAPAEIKQACQPSEVVANVCMDMGNISVSHEDTANVNQEECNSSTTEFMAHNGDLVHHDCEKQVKMRLQSGGIPAAGCELHKTNGIAHENFMTLGGDNVTPDNNPTHRDLDSSPSESTVGGEYTRQCSPLTGKQNKPLSNTNTCNNTSLQMKILSEDCESGYISTEQPLKDEDN